MPDLDNIKVDVAQIGARMHYAVPVLFHQNNLLNHFYTDFWFPHLFLGKGLTSLLSLIPKFKSQVSVLKSRNHEGLPSEKVISNSVLGYWYRNTLKSATSREDETLAYLEMGNRFTQWVSQTNKVAGTHIYGFNTASEKIFQSHKYRHSVKILEQTLVPRISERTILQEEFKKRKLSIPTDRLSKEYEALEKREWELADYIVCGSEFVKSELQKNDVSPQKIHVIPYGFTQKQEVQIQPKSPTGKLRILFAGSGGIRKGLLYAIEGLRPLSEFVELHVAGIHGLSDSLKANDDFIVWHDLVPRPKMQDLFQDSDVFLLPSLCEGSATVIYEALSYGLAIVCTENSGSVITHKKEGLLVKTANSKDITFAIQRFLDDGDFLLNAKTQALKTASEFTVEKYGERLIKWAKRTN